MIEDFSECYRVLELQPGATLEDVKRSYRELVKVWHPDRFASDPSLQKKAQEKLKQINLSYERICKGETAGSRSRTSSARPPSAGTEQKAKPPGSPESQKQRPGHSPPPEAESSEGGAEGSEPTSQQGKEPKWAHAAIGFGFLALSLWLMPTIWDDFSKYESGEGIRTTRNAFLLYQLLGKQGLVVFFLLFGLFMGYVGLCHTRALLSGQRYINFNLRKGFLIGAAVILGFFVLIGDRPGRRTARNQTSYTQPSPTYSAQTPSVIQPQPKVRPTLAINQILVLHREALKENPNLQISVQEFSRYAQANQTEYDFSEGIAYVPPPRASKPIAVPPTPAIVSGQPVTSVPLVSMEAKPVVDNPKAEESAKIELAVASEHELASPVQRRSDSSFFSVGSTKDEVLTIQGTPANFTDSYFSYGSSTVYFQNGRVKSWSDGFPKLKAELLPSSQTEPKEFFTVGSTKDDVLAIQGTPANFTDSYFSYGSSTVYFQNGRVKSWSDGFPNLKAKLLPSIKVEAMDFFTVGSTKDEVLTIQGTPANFTDSYFSYGSSTVYFQNKRVKSWSDGFPKLKAKLLPSTKVEAMDFFTVGSTKDEVLTIQGTPANFTDSYFSYGSSTVYFQNGRVTSWSDGYPKLKVRLPASGRE